MQYAMQVFQYEDDTDFRVIDQDGEPWFVLSDVCKKLGIAHAASAARILDDDEKDVLTLVATKSCRSSTRAGSTR